MLPQLIMTLKGAVLLFLAARGFAWLLRPDDARWLKGAPTIILIAMFVIGMFGHTVWVPYAALLLALPLLAKDRADTAALYVVAAVAVPELYLNIGFGGIYLLAFDKWFVLALGLAIAFKIKPATGGAPGKRFDVAFWLLFALAAAQARDSNATGTVRALLDPLLTLALPFYLISRSLTRIEDVQRFTLAFAFAGFAMACVAFVESRTGWLIYKQITANLHLQTALNGYLKQRAGMLRSPASFPESTSLGTFLAMAMMASFAVRQKFASTGKWLGALAVIMVGLLAANSRGAWVGVGIGLIAFDLYRRHFASLATKLAAIGGIYLVLLLASPFSRYAATLVGKSSDTASTSDYRVMLIQRGMEEIRKHPYLGVSLQNALLNLQDMRQGEGIIDIVNGYIFYGLTVGVGGIVAFLLVFVSTCVAMLIARKQLALDKATEAVGAFVFAVASFMIFACFFTGFGGRASSPFYEIVALGAAVWAIRRTVTAPHRSVIPRAGSDPDSVPDIVPAPSPGFARPVPVRVESPAGAAYRARRLRAAGTVE